MMLVSITSSTIRAAGAHHQCAAQSTHYHYAFKAQVDYAGMLGEAAAKGHQQQNRSEQQGVLYQQYH